jgi:hypothetical protein
MVQSVVQVVVVAQVALVEMAYQLQVVQVALVYRLQLVELQPIMQVVVVVLLLKIIVQPLAVLEVLVVVDRQIKVQVFQELLEQMASVVAVVEQEMDLDGPDQVVWEEMLLDLQVVQVL